jgi:hypothetical protein
MSAMGSIFLRKTPGLRIYTIAFYVNFCNLIVSGILIFTLFKNTLEGFEGLKFVSHIDTMGWVWFGFVGFGYVMADGCKYAAYTRREPGELQIYSFLPRLVQILIDSIVVGVAFTSL